MLPVLGINIKWTQWDRMALSKNPRPNEIQEELLQIHQYQSYLSNVFFVTVMTQKMLEIEFGPSTGNGVSIIDENSHNFTQLLLLLLLLYYYFLYQTIATRVTDGYCVILNYIITNALTEMALGPVFIHVLCHICDCNSIYKCS